MAHNCIHAEANAVINCDSPRSTEKIVFVTNLPCPTCAKYMINLGNVKKVYYAEDYRIRVGLDILTQTGIQFSLLKPTDESVFLRGLIDNANAIIAQQADEMKVLQGEIDILDCANREVDRRLREESR